MKSKRTFILVVISLVLSLATFVIQEWFSVSEIYPFYSWKLYTQPICGDCPFSDYRIYGVKDDGDTVRLENKGYRAFNREDYNGFLSGEAAKMKSVEKYSKAYFKRRLATFGDLITGDAFDTYLLVEERFVPFKFKNSDTFETEVLLSSTQSGTAHF